LTAFDKNFMFLDKPGGEIENLAQMKADGFHGVFCNVHAYDPSLWTLVRQRAAAEGMFCGPWARLDPEGKEFKLEALNNLITVGRAWNAPYIINAEKDIDNSGDQVTKIIAATVGSDDCAISMESWLFSAVDWRPVAHIPMLLQIFPVEAPVARNPAACKERAHTAGVKCVYFTFGTYGGMKPGDFNLQTPYSLFTGNAMGGVFAPWSPTSTGFKACIEEVISLPDIGSQNGIVGFMKWLRIQPNVPVRGSNYDPNNIATWPWPDKLERTLTMLVEDHDGSN